MNLSKNKIIAGVIGLIAVVGVVNTQAIVKLSKVNSASYSQSAQAIKFSAKATDGKVFKRGDKSEVILQVQKVLTEQGFYKSDISGLFGPRTETAIKAFQLANQLKATGVLDLKTQDAILKINRGGGNDTILPPCGRLSDPWIRVTSPNGGEVYQAGQQINVTWRSCKIPADTTARIAFSSQFEGGNSQNVITPNAGSVSYEIPSTTSFPPLEYGNYYKIYIDFPSLNVQGDMSDNFFSITEGEGCAEGTIIGYNSNGTPIYCGEVYPFVKIKEKKVSINNIFGQLSGNTEKADFVFNFEVTAINGDVYVKMATENEDFTNTPGQGIPYSIETVHNNNMPNSMSDISCSASCQQVGNSVVKISNGTTTSFTVRVSVRGQFSLRETYNVALNSLNWGTSADNINNYYHDDMASFTSFQQTGVILESI